MRIEPVLSQFIIIPRTHNDCIGKIQRIQSPTSRKWTKLWLHTHIDWSFWTHSTTRENYIRETQPKMRWRKNNIHIELIESEFHDENTWLRAASVVHRRTGWSLINSSFFRRLMCGEYVCLQIGLCFFFGSFFRCIRIGSQNFSFFINSFSWYNLVHWRLLSLFNMRALEPIPMFSAFSSDTFSHSFGSG